MKQSVTVNKSAEAKWAEGIKNSISKDQNQTPKTNDLATILQKVIIPLISIVSFIGVWHIGAEALRQREINFRIEKTLADQGQLAADAT